MIKQNNMENIGIDHLQRNKIFDFYFRYQYKIIIFNKTPMSIKDFTILAKLGITILIVG